MSSPATVARRPPSRTGRRRDPRIERSVLDATTALLAEVGYRALTIDRVAERAGVGKPAIYRRWPSKVALVTDALFPFVEQVSVSDSGNVRRDLIALLERYVAFLARSPGGRLLRALIGEVPFDPELARIADSLISARRSSARQLVRRAIERRELRAVDPDLVVDLLVGPLHQQFLVDRRTPTRATATAIVDAVLTGISRRRSR